MAIIKEFNEQLAPNFHIREFACKDGTQVPYNLVPNVQKLAKNLQVLRDYLNGAGRPKKAPKTAVLTLGLNSGFRNDTYNEKVGGEDDSFHIEAMAADFTQKYMTPRELAYAIEKLIAEGKMEQGGIGIYAGFVHYDVRGYKARWNG